MKLTQQGTGTSESCRLANFIASRRPPLMSRIFAKIFLMEIVKRNRGRESIGMRRLMTIESVSIDLSLDLSVLTRADPTHETVNGSSRIFLRLFSRRSLVTVRRVLRRRHCH